MQRPLAKHASFAMSRLSKGGKQSSKRHSPSGDYEGWDRRQRHTEPTARGTRRIHDGVHHRVIAWSRSSEREGDGSRCWTSVRASALLEDFRIVQKHVIGRSYSRRPSLTVGAEKAVLASRPTIHRGSHSHDAVVVSAIGFHIPKRKWVGVDALL